VAAKSRLRPVLDLAGSGSANEHGQLLAEFVLQDHFMALGRVRYGSVEVLGDALRICRDQVHTFLLDLYQMDTQARAELAECVSTAAPDATVISYDSEELEAWSTAQILTQLPGQPGARVALLWEDGRDSTGAKSSPLLLRLVGLFDTVIIRGAAVAAHRATGRGRERVVSLEVAEDDVAGYGPADCLVVRSVPPAGELSRLCPLMREGAWVVYSGLEPHDRLAEFAADQRWRLLFLPRDEMYRGQLPRWLASQTWLESVARVVPVSP
jgi:hypothetical protein